MAAGKGTSKGDASVKAVSAAHDAEAALEREAAQLSYEEALERLETIIERVERGEIGLEESLQEYRRGRALLKRCRAILDVAEQDIRRMSLADAEAAAANDSDDAPPARGGR